MTSLHRPPHLPQPSPAGYPSRSANPALTTLAPDQLLRNAELVLRGPAERSLDLPTIDHLDPAAPPADTISLDAESLTSIDHVGHLADRLAPLGRLIIRCPARDRPRIADLVQSWAARGAHFNAPGRITRFAKLADLAVAHDRDLLCYELMTGALTLDTPQRVGATDSSYKLSRYAAYRQMLAAVASMIDVRSLRDVVEIGDSTGAVRTMLGPGDFSFTAATHPPHDLQHLHAFDDDSFDAFICDNTLEHVARPDHAFHQMHRVLRPGGWLLIMAPVLSMVQDDDRCRWTAIALAQQLRQSFTHGLVGGWGNVDAACAYLRHNKWLRVVSVTSNTNQDHTTRTDHPRETALVEDARPPHAPAGPGHERLPSPLRLPLDDDRRFPLHVWGVVRKPHPDDAANRPSHSPLPELVADPRFDPSHLYSLEQFTDATSSAAAATPRVALLNPGDGTIADELRSRGFDALALTAHPAEANHCRARNVPAQLLPPDPDAPLPPQLLASFDRLVAFEPPHRQPRTLDLATAAALLKPGAVALWRDAPHPDQTTHQQLEQLRAHAHSAGFRILNDRAGAHRATALLRKEPRP